jgi:hypothetical protein
MDKLLTQDDLAERWQVSKRSIENWRKEGILQPVKGIPAIRFSPEYIAELEGVKLEKTSPLQVKRLERELEEMKRENEKLKGIISNILAETSQIINF